MEAGHEVCFKQFNWMTGRYLKLGILAGLLALIGIPAVTFAQEPAIEGRAALLVDAQTGKILYTKDPDGQFAPASTIKLLTALIVWERTKLQGNVQVQPADTYVEPSHIPLHSGETVPVDHLVHALLIGSDNDSAMALARYTAGSVDQFVALMNQRARQLGCTGTVVKNPHGLPIKGQYTTAKDMLKIFEAVLAVPQLREICSTPRYQLTTEIGTQTIKNHNKLLGSYAGMGPAKTGWTASSRHTYAACATRSGRELHLIILNSPNKWNDARALFDYGFKQSPSGPQAPLPGGPLIASTPPAPSKTVAPASAPANPEPVPAPVAVNSKPAPTAARLDVASISAPSAKAQPANSKGLTVYKVRKGDTLSAICRRFDVSVKTVLEHNNLPNPHVINPGLILYIPLQS
jgi:D-alanyl-D-alanine carboxypeptidase